MIYKQSKVNDAILNWSKYYDKINEALRKENGYGLPAQYQLEIEADKWDFYDLFVIGFQIRQF